MRTLKYEPHISVSASWYCGYSFTLLYTSQREKDRPHQQISKQLRNSGK